MIADFVILVHYGEKPRGVRIKVHDNVAALRSAATKHSRLLKNERSAAEEKAVGVCHRFYMEKDPVCALVRLAPPHIGIGVVSHELCHAAVWFWEIEHQFKDVPMTCHNDEQFCWVLGELVHYTTDKLYEKGVWK
jgi:hypothetical protein